MVTGRVPIFMSAQDVVPATLPIKFAPSAQPPAKPPFRVGLIREGLNKTFHPVVRSRGFSVLNENLIDFLEDLVWFHYRLQGMLRGGLKVIDKANER